jgi:EmrB/QacA subfamily drug resistance transporter
MRTPLNRWLILAIVGFAQFMVILDATIVNVALPAIQDDLGFSRESLQWVVNGYTLAFGGFLLLGGRAGDLFGRRRLFVLGVSLFTVASLLDGLAQSEGMLIASRALQGLGAALVSPAALSIVTTTFTGGADRAKALGVWSAISAGGGAVGLLLGGVLTDQLSWQWIFFVNVPIGLLALGLALRFVPESRLTARTGFDLGGAALVTAGLVVLVFAITKAQAWGWGDGRTIALEAAAAALLVGWGALESRLRHPLIRLGVFRIRTLASANGAMLLVGGALFSMFFFGSLYLQNIKGYDALQTGLAFLPMTVGIIAGAAMSQALIRRFGVKPVLIGGLLVAASGLLILTGLSPDSSYATSMLPGLVLMAVGMGNTFTPLTLTATTNVGPEEQGLASGLFTTAQQVGGALGLAILSTIASGATDTRLGQAHGRPDAAAQAAALVHGYTTAFEVGVAFMLAGVLMATVVLRRRDVAHVNVDMNVGVDDAVVAAA